MRTTVFVDGDLIKAARSAAGVKTKREAIKLGLRTLLRPSQQARIRKFRGKLAWMGDLDFMRLDG